MYLYVYIYVKKCALFLITLILKYSYSKLLKIIYYSKNIIILLYLILIHICIVYNTIIL